MKKIILGILVTLVVVLVLAVVAVSLFLDKAVKRGVETFGPRLTKVDVTLRSVRLSLLSGSGSINGLMIGNPQGFKTPTAIQIGTVSLALEPRSLLSDKVVVKSLNFQGPEVTFETDLRNNNLKKILANVQEASGGGAKEPGRPQEPGQPTETKPAKKLQVDDLVIAGGKVHVAVTGLGAGQSATLPLPDIHLQALGTGPDGITAADLTKRVLQAIEQGAAQAAAGTVADIGKGALYFGKDAGRIGSNALDSATKSIGNIFKKK